MPAKLVRRLLVVWPCVAFLSLPALPPAFAQGPKPKAKVPETKGAWNLVSWDKNGREQPRTMARIYITPTMRYADGVLLPDGKRHAVWPYDLDPGSSLRRS
jgi:hypothetical protein